MSEAIGYLLTFTTYGTHLHGHEAGSVSRTHRNWAAPVIEASQQLEERATSLMPETPFLLGEIERRTVLDAVVSASNSRHWHVYCAHVRTTHVHLVIQPLGSIDRVLAYLKARATFALKPLHPVRQRFWTKHGSTRYLWDRNSLVAAMDYVIHQQGAPMAVFIEQC